MYEDLEEMWAQSTHDIGAIDPGELSTPVHADVADRQV